MAFGLALLVWLSVVGPAAADGGALYPLPEIVTKILPSVGTPQVMTLHAQVELEPNAAHPEPPWFKAVETAFRARLSEYTIDDLKGPAGMYRLREDLLEIARSLDPSIKVRDILFREMRVE